MSVLTFEIKQQWQLNNIIVIPLVLSATVDIPNALNQNRSALNAPPHLLSQVQKVILLNCSIVRMFLTAKVHFHAVLQCSRPCTLIAIIPGATPQQPALWELDNTGHSLRQSKIMVTTMATLQCDLYALSSYREGKPLNTYL
jgi:hypothetical protein